MVEQKTGLKTNEKIICIGFIILLLILIILPPCLRQIQAIKNKKIAEELKATQEALTSEIALTCTKYEELGETELRFWYTTSGDLARYEFIEVITYDEVNAENQADFDSKTALCTETETLFDEVSGYSRNCRQRTNRFITSISYDLNLFKEAKVTRIDGSEISVKSDYKKTDEKDKLKEKLTEDGYTCQEEE